jgi:hypothetical protein
VAYWYAAKPTKVVTVPPVAQRLTVLKDEHGEWIDDPARQLPGKPVRRTAEMSASMAPMPTLHINGRRSAPTLASVPALLKTTKPVPIGGEKPYAQLRLGLAGKMLAVCAEVQDTKISRDELRFWEASAVELFAARSKSARVGQVVLLPAAGKAADSFQVYDRGNRRPNARGIQVRSTRTKNGYQICGLIPLSFFDLDPNCREFMFDCAISTLADAAGQPRRTGIGQWPGVYATAVTHSRVMVER